MQGRLTPVNRLPEGLTLEQFMDQTMGKPVTVTGHTLGHVTHVWVEDGWVLFYASPVEREES